MPKSVVTETQLYVSRWENRPRQNTNPRKAVSLGAEQKENMYYIESYKIMT